jgi:negative regulator of flagellin synthesis FlgM
MEKIVTDKITGPGGPFPAAGPQGRVNGGSRGADAPPAAGSPAPGADAVSLTGDAEMLRALDAKIASTPTVDRALVERVRTALANGEYQVDGERIAEKLLAAESSLGALLFRN